MEQQVYRNGVKELEDFNAVPFHELVHDLHVSLLEIRPVGHVLKDLGNQHQLPANVLRRLLLQNSVLNRRHKSKVDESQEGKPTNGRSRGVWETSVNHFLWG